MSIGRDDRYVTDAQGRALAGAAVYYCTQPASTAAIPPSPLATVYTSLTGGTTETQPVITDGFGHSFAYLDDSQLYAIVVSHPLFGTNPVVLQDQAIPATGGGGAQIPFAGIPSGTINGTNRVFTLTNSGTPLTLNPTSLAVLLNGIQQVPGLGYSISGVVITYAVAPQAASGSFPADSIYAQGFTP